MQGKTWFSFITICMAAFLPMAHADTVADYINEQTFGTSGSAALVLEGAIDAYLMPIEVQQIGSSVYNSIENYGSMGSTKPTSSPQLDFVTAHISSYCSPNLPIEQQNFQCSGQSSNTDSTTAQYLEMGDIRPSVLLEPLTYNNQALWWAGHNFIKNITMPFPSQNMANFISNPNTFNGNASQKRAYASYMSNQGLLSVARYALDAMFGMRVTGTQMGSNANGNATANLSIMGVMENEATRRFIDPNYVTFINGTSSNPSVTQQNIIADLAAMNAFSLWMQYQSYRQNERIAAMLAAILANNVSGTFAASAAAINAGAPQ